VSFLILSDELESTTKALLLHTRIQWLIEGKAVCVVVGAASRTSCFFHRTSFLLERMPDKLWLFRLGYVAHIFSKVNTVNCFP